MPKLLLFLFLLLFISNFANAQNGIYILNLHNQNFEAFARSDTNAYINYYSTESKTPKVIFANKKIAKLKTLFLPAIIGKEKKYYGAVKQRLEIISLEDTCRIDFIDVNPNKKDTMFDLAFVAGSFIYYRNAEKRIKEIFGAPIEKENIVNIKDAMLRGFHLNSIQYLTNYKIIEANYAPLKPLFLKKICKQDALVKEGTTYYYLCKQNINEASASLHINTSVKPKQINGYNYYQFLYNNLQNSSYPINVYGALVIDSLFLNLQAKKLLINNQPFTGFLDIAYSYVVKNNSTKFEFEDVEQRVTINHCQFNNGKFENATVTSDATLYSEPFRPLIEKPVLYLYPTKKQEISVKLQFATHTLSTSYPTYNNGWNVVAMPNGDLINKATNKKHYCLYWETQGKPIVDKLRTGFVVEGKNIEKFLEEKLKTLGLNEKEANEFIIYWLPQMENNVANAIYFATDEYEKESTLTILPNPIQTIRVMMLWQPLENINFILMRQELKSITRKKGFIAVEWGGSKVNIFKRIVP